MKKVAKKTILENQINSVKNAQHPYTDELDSSRHQEWGGSVQGRCVHDSNRSYSPDN